MSHEFPPETPRERQTICLPASKLASLRDWAVNGTGLTAAARVRDADGRIALVKNGWSEGWILPGGGVKSGERSRGAAEREVREETGLNATIGTPLVVLEQSYISESDGKERFSAEYVVYSARSDGEIPDASQLGVTSGEIAAARWFETLPENLHDGNLLRAYLR